MPHVQTEYTGRLLEVVHGAFTLEGLTKVSLSEEDGPDAEQLNMTRALHTEYTFMTDPLGSKGDDKTTLTATCWASSASYADSKATAIPFNTAASTVLDTAKGVTTANTYTNTVLELVERRTDGAWDAYTQVTLTFSANALGAWTGPA